MVNIERHFAPISQNGRQHNHSHLFLPFVGQNNTPKLVISGRDISVMQGRLRPLVYRP